MQEKPHTPLCRYCSRPLKGRSDKKFCDDQCRNTYNNQQKRQRSDTETAINRLLHRNRSILEWVWEQKRQSITVNREDLLRAGYHFRYHTHSYTNRKGGMYRYCYEYGLLQLDPERYLVVKEEKNRLFELPHPDLPLGNRIMGGSGDEAPAGFTTTMANK